MKNMRGVLDMYHPMQTVSTETGKGGTEQEHQYLSTKKAVIRISSQIHGAPNHMNVCKKCYRCSTSSIKNALPENGVYRIPKNCSFHRKNDDGPQLFWAPNFETKPYGDGLKPVWGIHIH